MARKTLKIACLIMSFGLTGYLANAAEDPTAPLDWAKPQVTNKPKVRKNYSLPSIQSIVCEQDSQGCYAIMNNKMVNRGEVISGYKIINITSEKVDITRSGKRWELRLFPLDFKQ